MDVRVLQGFNVEKRNLYLLFIGYYFCYMLEVDIYNDVYNCFL